MASSMQTNRPVQISRTRLVQLSAALLLLALCPAALSARAHDGPEIEYFKKDGCLRCEEASAYLATLTERDPDIRVIAFDIERDAAARQRVIKLCEQAGYSNPGVPVFAIGDRVIVGFLAAETPERIEQALRDPTADTKSIRLPVFGRVDPRDIGLPAFTLAVGLVDGFNPCATWVLLFLLGILVNLKSRPRMFAIGGVFVVVSGLVYFAFMAAWLNLFLVLGASRPITLVLGAIAVFIGAVNVKDFFAFGRGISLGIPDRAKPGLYARMRRILSAEHLGGALAAAAVLALLVNVVELLCTAGLPAIYTAVLTAHDLSPWQYYGYLGLYMLAYMFDDALMLTVAVVTLSSHKLQERGARVLKLIAGVLMLVLGLVLLIRPQLLGG